MDINKTNKNDKKHTENLLKINKLKIKSKSKY